ncbi:MAG TPA: hypothetical protein VFE62_27075 [Gemmataceae bacterium]|nr:hypothetical protein [Gemmataceae bacterium]
MTTPSPEGIYRAMVDEGGMPKLGLGAKFLGIRIGKDIEVDANGAVHRPAFRPREKNGLSCAASIEKLPLFSLPVEWGGSNKWTVVWRIEEADLVPELVSGDDSTPGTDRHISIGPSATMDYNDYVRAIEATRPFWIKVTKI